MLVFVNVTKSGAVPLGGLAVKSKPWAKIFAMQKIAVMVERSSFFNMGVKLEFVILEIGI